MRGDLDRIAELAARALAERALVAEELALGGAHLGGGLRAPVAGAGLAAVRLEVRADGRGPIVRAGGRISGVAELQRVAGERAGVGGVEVARVRDGPRPRVMRHQLGVRVDGDVDGLGGTRV